MAESTFRIYLCEAIKMAGGHASKIESHDLSPGIPDISFRVKDTEGFIECKDGRTPHLRPSQYRWIRDRVSVGGQVWIAWQYDGFARFIKGTRIEMLKQAKHEDWLNATQFLCSPYDIESIINILTLWEVTPDGGT